MTRNHDTQADSEVLSAATLLGLGNALFKDVPIGGKFRFKGSDVYIKTKSGYKSVNGGRTYKTGQRTAVFYPLESES